MKQLKVPKVKIIEWDDKGLNFVFGGDTESFFIGWDNIDYIVFDTDRDRCQGIPRHDKWTYVKFFTNDYIEFTLFSSMYVTDDGRWLADVLQEKEDLQDKLKISWG